MVYLENKLDDGLIALELLPGDIIGINKYYNVVVFPHPLDYTNSYYISEYGVDQVIDEIKTYGNFDARKILSVDPKKMLNVYSFDYLFETNLTN